MTPGRSGRQKKFKHTPRKSSRKLPLAIGLLIIIGVVGVAVYMFGMNGSSSPAENNSNVPSGNVVLLQTSMGNITIQLRDDKPTTTNNFKTLVQQGVYDGTIFHRVIADFMIQGGMNTSASVATIPDEIGSNNHNVIGTIAMAKTSQPNSATSQFFINVADNSKITYQNGSTFDGTYTVFGTVTSGMDVANAISQVATDSNDKPLTDVTLIKAEIIS
jgi:cyclophilin family peptidyl-prolyl cis-trans isomerase